METGDNSNVQTKREKNFYIGTTKIIVPRARTTMENFMKEGLIEDWDLFEKIVEHSYENILYSNPSEHPVLFSESAWNDRGRREKLTELMFEKFQVPAYYLSKNVVLSCFAQGRTHGLMVDSGASQTSTLFSNVTVTGGNSLILGFTERLNYALATKCPPTIKLRVFAAPTPQERKYGAWIGGSILGSLVCSIQYKARDKRYIFQGTFQQMWVSKAEYDETGKVIVDKKCP
ncbi:hypothetical protein CRE_24886 [Caenorhabditis remanei]|uniref:Uncharacterized protein n=1 Tax=Caenorhabditis remanei TaxID=31234 RepID=E3NPN2_CAERE|nr:hypothetical protein CRE_24886 [Caenorhabditis remanei]